MIIGGYLLLFHNKLLKKILELVEKFVRLFKKNFDLTIDEFIEEYNGNYPIKLYFDMEHFKEVMREIEALSKKSNVQLRFSPKFEYCKNPLESIEKFFSYDETKPITDIYKPCVYPYFTKMINPEGEVYPCLSQRIGNVKESSLKELFNMPSYRCFRKNLKAAGGCFGACQMCCELEPKG